MADPLLLAQVSLKFLRENVVMPVKIDGAKTILTANPTQFEPLDQLTLLLGTPINYAVATPKTIIDAINRYYPIEGTKQMIAELEEEKELGEVDFGAIEETDILGAASEAPIIKLVNHILYQAVKQGLQIFI